MNSLTLIKMVRNIELINIKREVIYLGRICYKQVGIRQEILWIIWLRPRSLGLVIMLKIKRFKEHKLIKLLDKMVPLAVPNENKSHLLDRILI